MDAKFKKLTKLEKGIYSDAAKSGKPLSSWLEDFITTEEGGGFEPTPYKGLTQHEVLQKRKALRASGQDVPPTAFEMTLHANGIKAFGAYTDTVGKMFEANGAVLFPEFMQNRVYAGKIQASIVPHFISETIVIKGLNYHEVYLGTTEGDRQTGKTARATEFPRKRIEVNERSVALDKFGINLVFDYESIQDTPLNLYGATLKQVGLQLGVDESDDLITKLVANLDSGNVETTEATGVIEKKDIIKLAAALDLPYQLKVFVGRKNYMIAFWDALSDMQNPATQWGQTGMVLPQGYAWDRDPVTADRFIGVDPDTTATLITNDVVMMTETDRIISKQVIETVLSTRSKFNITDTAGIGALDIEHA